MQDLTRYHKMLSEVDVIVELDMDLRDTNFFSFQWAGVRISGDVTGMNWRNRDLSGLEFNGVVLKDIDFSGSNLSCSRFVGCDLAGANFNDTKLKHACFEANWNTKKASFTCDSSETIFEDNDGSFI